MTASREKTESRKLPMMPIRDMVIFPYMMTPFVVGRESSVRALEEALTGDRKIFLATQHDATIDEPKAMEIFQVGSIKVLVEGVERAKSVEVNDKDGFFVATVRVGKTQFEMTPAVEQLMTRVTGLFEQYVKLQQSLNYETIIATVRMDEPAKLTDTIAANLQLGIEEKQELLAIFDPATGLLTAKTDALNRAVTQTYNLRGQTATRTLARGATTTFVYDANTGELLSQTYSDTTPAVTYTYNRQGKVATVADVTDTRTCPSGVGPSRRRRRVRSSAPKQFARFRSHSKTKS